MRFLHNVQHNLQFVEYFEIFKISFTKILDFLRRLKTRPKLPQDISYDWNSHNCNWVLFSITRFFFYFADTLVIIVKLRILHLILLNSLFLQKFIFAYFKENLVGWWITLDRRSQNTPNIISSRVMLSSKAFLKV